ncbi:hypothetical protein Bca4012_082091 [Brassica carinata]
MVFLFLVVGPVLIPTLHTFFDGERSVLLPRRYVSSSRRRLTSPYDPLGWGLDDPMCFGVGRLKVYEVNDDGSFFEPLLKMSKSQTFQYCRWNGLSVIVVEFPVESGGLIRCLERWSVRVRGCRGGSNKSSI